MHQMHVTNYAFEAVSDDSLLSDDSELKIQVEFDKDEKNSNDTRQRNWNES